MAEAATLLYTATLKHGARYVVLGAGPNGGPLIFEKDTPVPIDGAIKARLDAFALDPKTIWAIDASGEPYVERQIMEPKFDIVAEEPAAPARTRA